MKAEKTILIAAATMAMLTACGKNEETQTEAVEELPKVETNVVTAREVPQINEYTATVEADNINNIAPASPNRIKSIAVEVGDHVRKGQTLVRLDPANSDQLKINLDQIKREYDRAVRLLEIGGGTRQAVDQLKAQLDAAQSQYDNMLENTVLVSPINGVVTARNYDPGDMTGSLPIVTVARVQPVKIVINVTESDLPKIHNGMPAEVTFDTYGDEKFNGRVSTVMPTVDPASRTFGVEVTLPNADSRVLPGMFGRVRLNLGKADRVVIPDKAVVKQQGSGNQYVYIYNSNGTVSFNQVQLGQRLGDEYEVISGVEPGSRVVINGQSKLANGKKVKLAK